MFLGYNYVNVCEARANVIMVQDNTYEVTKVYYIPLTIPKVCDGRLRSVHVWRCRKLAEGVSERARRTCAQRAHEAVP